MTSEIEIWDQVIKGLRSKLSEPEIRTWFSQSSLKSLNNNKAIIAVPNKFIANWLKDNYLSHINNYFKILLDEIPDVQFKVTSKKLLNITKKASKDNINTTFISNNLNRSMTFDTFVTGECNNFAYSSAVEVSTRPGNYYNPLYIYSGPSQGKTHLLNAVGNNIYNQDHSVNIAYIYSKVFISDFNNSLRYNNLNKFKDKYNNLDIMLFDDIHFLSKHNKVQEEFLSIFNNLYGERKQIVITGNSSPNSLKNINSQLKSRLGWGLLTQMDELDYDTKFKIIKNKIKKSKINIPNDILSFLLKINSDLKTLLKNIIRIESYVSLNNGNINLSLVKSLLNNRSSVDIDIKDIQSLLSDYFNISLSDLISAKKKVEYSYPRHLAMYLCRKYTDLSFKEIGYNFGDRDHSSIIYAVRKIEKLKKQKQKNIKDDLSSIENLLV